MTNKNEILKIENKPLNNNNEEVIVGLRVVSVGIFVEENACDWSVFVSGEVINLKKKDFDSIKIIISLMTKL